MATATASGQQDLWLIRLTLGNEIFCRDCFNSISPSHFLLTVSCLKLALFVFCFLLFWCCRGLKELITHPHPTTYVCMPLHTHTDTHMHSCPLEGLGK